MAQNLVLFGGTFSGVNGFRILNNAGRYVTYREDINPGEGEYTVETLQIYEKPYYHVERLKVRDKTGVIHYYVKKGTPTSLEVISPPEKTSYIKNAVIDYTGLEVAILDENGERWTCEQYPFGTIPFEELVLPIRKAGYDRNGIFIHNYTDYDDTLVIPVQWKRETDEEYLETSFNIHTSNQYPWQLRVTHPPYQTEYNEDDELIFDGLVVTIYDNRNNPWTNDGVYVNGVVPRSILNFSELIATPRPEGTTPIEVIWYGPDGIEMSATFNITVESKIPVRLKVLHTPNRNHYTSGAAINYDGIQVVAVKDNDRIWADMAHYDGLIPIEELTAPESLEALEWPVWDFIVPTRNGVLGDVTIRRIAEDIELMYVYAAYLENGNIQFYRKKVYADLDEYWQPLWTYPNNASEVAIEFDGVWKIDLLGQWYYLEMEEEPYVFTVEDDNLYVQKWQDFDSRFLLAENVENISVCKGYTNNFTHTLDQGLIVAYRRNNKAYYRAYCYQPNDTKAWENEIELTQFGNNVDFIRVIRTNDFRVGFIAENNNNLKLILSTQNWVGETFKPEYLTLFTNGMFFYQFKNIYWGYHNNNNLQLSFLYNYFNYENNNDDNNNPIIRYEKINRPDIYYSYGAKIYYQFPIYCTQPEKLISHFSVVALIGTSNTTINISSTQIDIANHALEIYFSTDVKRVHQITIVGTSLNPIWYYRTQGQKWFLSNFTIVLEPEVNTYYGFTKETIKIYTNANFNYQMLHTDFGYNKNVLKVTTLGNFVYVPKELSPI